jgi:hypothetical protein
MPIVALAAAGAGLTSALLHGALLSGSFGAIILAYLAQLPLFVIGLWIGSASAAIAAVTAVVVLAVVGGFLFAIAYLIVNAAPALLMTYLAQHSRIGADGEREWYPPGLLITWLVGLAALTFLALSLFYADVPGGIEGMLHRGLDAAFSQLGAPTDAASNEAVAALARFMPGVIAASWIAMVVINGVLAQGLLARFGRNLRPSPRMAEIDLPPWLIGAVAIALVGAFMPGHPRFIGANLFLILMPAYVLAGLGVVHALTARMASRGLLLTATYALVLLSGWPLIIAALLGLAEPWLNLRRRVGGGAGT